MAIKINRILINNFKPFRKFEVNFNKANFIVFDGPNGFGKTSFYDAIELLLTGRLRRYDELYEMTIYGKKNINGCPFLNDQNSTGDLVIKGEFNVNDEIICLKRVGKRAELITPNNAHSYNFTLYESNQYDNPDYLRIDDEVSYLEKLLGKNYKENFQFLNYIEQEENIYLLKKTDKDRKEQIEHLFNTSEFESKILKLTEAQKKIGELCGTEAKKDLEVAKNKLSDLQTKLTSGASETPYKRIIPWKKIPWDSEQLEFPLEQYVEWLGTDGEIKKLEVFLENIEEFQRERENKQLDKLFADEKLINQLLLYWNFLSKADELSKNLELLKLSNDFIKTCENGVLFAIEMGKIIIPSQLHVILPKDIDISAYSKEVAVIQVLQKNANALSRLLIDVKNYRNAFIEKYKKYEEQAGAEKICPLCGYSWQAVEELKQKINAHTHIIEELIKVSGNELNIAADSFNKKYLAPIIECFKNYILKHTIDETFVNKLKIAAKNRVNLERLFKQFTTADIDLAPFLNCKLSEEEQVNFDKLRDEINKKKHALNLEKLQSYFSSIFLNIFDDSFENINNISKDNLLNKRKYIEWQYSIYQNKAIQKRKNELYILQKQFDHAKLLKDFLDALKKTYKKSLELYQANLIKDIEILFHIYSGRIAQESQGGLGLFIEAAGGKIHFLETHNKKHDAVFTMSSGQLSSLIIAFTLALNKKYSKHLLLFIDDPVQTLDELNIVGFIEVLRHQFLDRQIFISTHEDMMSAFMRYKFDKFGLKTQRLSFKERMLSTES